MGQFLAWCEARGLALAAVSPLHVAAYIRTHPGSAPTVKQHLAAIRMLGDWLVVSQVLPVNPAAAVRGPKHVVTKGATPVLSPAEARRLLEAIDTAALAGLRDRALVSVMLYSFARVSAVIGMRRQDYFRQESRGWLRPPQRAGVGAPRGRADGGLDPGGQISHDNGAPVDLASGERDDTLAVGRRLGGPECVDGRRKSSHQQPAVLQLGRPGARVPGYRPPLMCRASADRGARDGGQVNRSCTHVGDRCGS